MTLRPKQFTTAGVPRSATGPEDTRQNLQHLSSLVDAQQRRVSSAIPSVFDFDGVYGDGRDDTDGLQRALADETLLYWPQPETEYNISDPLLLRPGHTLIGASAAEVKIKGNLTAPLFQNTDPAVALPDVTIAGFLLDNTTSANVGGIGFDLTKANRWRLERVRVQNVETGFYTEGYGTIFGCSTEAVVTGIKVGAHFARIDDLHVIGATTTWVHVVSGATAVIFHPAWGHIGGLQDDNADGGLIVIMRDGKTYLPNGSQASPAVAFAKDTDLGLFRKQADVLGLSGGLWWPSGKLFGAYGATPAAQPAAIASPSGGATTDAEARTAIDSILAALRTLGIIAT